MARTSRTLSMGAALGVFMLVGCDAQPVASEVIQSAGGDSGPPPACMALEVCCPTLAMEVVSSCNKLSAQADEQQCASLLTALNGGGKCRTVLDAGMVVEAGGPADARDHVADASGLDADAGPAVACTLLETCCMSPALPSGETATCMSVQEENLESLCAPLLASLTASRSCGGISIGPGGACPDLQQCCSLESFPGVFSTSCLATWNAGDDSACASMLTTYVAAGYCGMQPDPDCAMLAMCCNEVSFPAANLATCQAIVSGNEGGNCLSAYDTYCPSP
jgi:hypothetical protein